MTQAAVIYAVADDRYSVFVTDGEGQIVYEYQAGNCPFDSQVYLDANDPYAEPREVLERYARETAHDIAMERGIHRVVFDPYITV